MIKQFIHAKISWLQRENYKSFYLAFLRCAISLWLLKEVMINWSSIDLLYGPSSFIIHKNTFLTWLPGGISFFRTLYTGFIILYAIVIILNLLGIGRWGTALLLFFMLDVIQKLNFGIVNGGHMMARLVLFYLVFANSYQYFVLYRRKENTGKQRPLMNLVSNLAAFSIMLQLCLAYLSSGIAKLSDPFWQHGEAIYYTLQMERFVGTPLNKYLVQHDWLGIIATYAVLLFELAFPLLIWIKKFRKPALISGIVFHLSLYIFLMIYGFQEAFVLIYGMFLSNNKLVRLKEEVIAWLRKVAFKLF